MHIINRDPFCDVRLQQIENRGKKTDKFMIEMMDPETNEFREVPGVGTVHSAGYKLVTNKQVRDMAQKVMQDSGLAFKPLPHQHMFWSGRRYAEKWYSPTVGLPVKGGSQMMLGVEISNSYDGSAKIGLSFFAMHAVCSNQFYGRNLMGDPFELQHSNRGGNLDDDIQDALNQINFKAANFAKIAPHINLLADTHVSSFDDFLGFRRELCQSTGVEFRDKQILDELSGCGITKELGLAEVKYADPSSYWDISNAYTAVTTHSVGGPRGADHCGQVIDWITARAAEKHG
jgi:hypothetical protein